jgi:hypothetical protein
VHRHFNAVALFALGLACAPQPQREAPDEPLDSLALERTVCFGFCPPYRLVVDRAGRVTFEPRPYDPALLPARDSISPVAFTKLLALVAQADLEALPPDIASDHTLCPVQATDHPWATITTYRGARVTSVKRYLGCYAGVDSMRPVLRLRPLVTLEEAIDSVTRVHRWLPPSP